MKTIAIIFAALLVLAGFLACAAIESLSTLKGR